MEFIPGHQGEMEKCGSLRHQSKGRKNEEIKEAGEMPGHRAEDKEMKEEGEALWHLVGGG
jgi:hypothetical protein